MVDGRRLVVNHRYREPRPAVSGSAANQRKGHARDVTVCGIAGVVLLERGGSIDDARLSAMQARLVHRGPDANGICRPSTSVALVHTRLAIVDPRVVSDQPMVDRDAVVHLVFNGEIYNFIELRRELERAGREFRTNSDTEVLLQAYLEWGEEAVSRLNGMWAFALYDARRESLFCSRDRFGVKPFYYAFDGRQFIFASEAKALLAWDADLREVDYRQLGQFLRESVHSVGPNTFFSRISQLRAGHNITVDSAGIDESRYWVYPVRETPKELGDAVEHVQGLLKDAVKLRLRRDAPLGLTLSGGLDSASIAALVRQEEGAPLRAYTASFPGESFDESRPAEELSSILGLEWIPVEVGRSPLEELLPQIVYHMDSPTQCPAVVPMWLIMQTMRRDVKVALEGQGADELFGGYVTQLIPHAAWELVRSGRIAAALRLGLELARTSELSAAAQWGLRSSLPSSHHIYRRLRGDEGLYQGALRVGHVRRETHSVPRLGRVNDALEFQHSHGLRSLLHYGDAMSMAHSIESRLPFLDYRLVEFVFSQPWDYKLVGMTGKVLLRDAVTSQLPRAWIATRRKLGFVTPLRAWLEREADSFVKPILLSPEMTARGIFDLRRLERMLNAFFSGNISIENQVFRWLTTELWFRSLVDSATPHRCLAS